jgi:hypothetical protein
MAYLLHVTTPSGATFSVTCASPFLRGLWIISLAGQPVTLRSEDRASA